MRSYDVPLSPVLTVTMASQRGVVTAQQVYAAGYSADDVRRWRADRVLISVRRGVYALASTYQGATPLDRHRIDTVAALLATDEPSVIGHESAAVWHDLELLRPDLSAVHLVRPAVRASRREAGIHHHLAGLPDGHVITVDGRCVTSAARTGIDVARGVDLARGVAVLDSVLRAGTSREELLRVMEECRSWPGARAAGVALTLADGHAANPGESWSRVLLVGGGLPPDDLQHPLYDDDGLIGLVDFWWRGGVVGEFDGRVKYEAPPDGMSATDVLVAEKIREDRIRALGHEVVRWTWNELLAPVRLVARVQRAHARAAMRLGRAS